MEQNDRVLFDHFAHYLGAPERVWTVNELPAKAPSPIYVGEFAPRSDEYDWLYLKIGMSRDPFSRRARPDHRIELLMYAKQRQPELASVLLQLAIYPFAHDTFFAAGHTIAGELGKGVVEGSELTEFLLTPVFFEAEGFDTVDLPDGNHVQVLWAIPITLTERMFALQHGWRSLVEGPFIECEVEPGDL